MSRVTLEEIVREYRDAIEDVAPPVDRLLLALGLMMWGVALRRFWR